MSVTTKYFSIDLNKQTHFFAGENTVAILMEGWKSWKTSNSKSVFRYNSKNQLNYIQYSNGSVFLRKAVQPHTQRHTHQTLLLGIKSSWAFLDVGIG